MTDNSNPEGNPQGEPSSNKGKPTNGSGAAPGDGVSRSRALVPYSKSSRAVVPYAGGSNLGSVSARTTNGVAKPKLREPSKGEVALHYATELNWYVFPLHYIREDGSCSCGKSDCKSKGKHPLTRHGVKDATLDPEKIKEMWRRWPNANIGIATGPSQLLVLDLDHKPEKGKDGAAAWAKLQAEHEQAPETLTQTTGSGGEHLLFDRAVFEGKIASWTGADGLDGRADGGYIVVAPGRNADGPYRWKDPSARVAPAPEWLCKWAANRAGGGKKDKANNKAGANGTNQAGAKGANQAGDKPTSHDEEARIISALKALPQSICDARGLDPDGGTFGWGNVNGALYESRLPNARALGDEWSQGSAAYGGTNGFPGPSKPELYSQAEQDRLWESFSKPHNRATTKMGSVFYHAEQNGWIDPVKSRSRKRHGKSFNQVPKGKGLVVINADEVEPEETTWICQDIIPLGKLSLFAGDPGLGKSQLSMYFAATVTTGGKWTPAMGDIPNAELGTVVILQAEDHVKDTIVPRLISAGADTRRVKIVQAVKTDTDAERVFSLETDLELLEDELAKLNDVRLIIIDPLSAYLGKIDSHNNAEVRAVLALLARFAEEHDVAVLSVTHLNKSKGNALSRVMGSISFAAAPRAVWLITRDTRDKEKRLFLPAKASNGPDASGYAFSVVAAKIDGKTKAIKTSKIVWYKDKETISANEALEDSAADAPAVETAKVFLLQMLKHPPLDASGFRGLDSDEIKRQAKAAGISAATLRRAKDKLKVRPIAIRDEQTGRVRYWLWQLPVFGDLSD
jgi:RecA-family ATPase